MAFLNLRFTTDKLRELLLNALFTAEERCNWSPGYLLPKYEFNGELNSALSAFTLNLPSYLSTDGALRYLIEVVEFRDLCTITNTDINIEASFVYYSQNTVTVPIKNSARMQLVVNFHIDQNFNITSKIEDIQLQPEVGKSMVLSKYVWGALGYEHDIMPRYENIPHLHMQSKYPQNSFQTPQVNNTQGNLLAGIPEIGGDEEECQGSDPTWYEPIDFFTGIAPYYDMLAAACKVPGGSAPYLGKASFGLQMIKSSHQLNRKFELNDQNISLSQVGFELFYSTVGTFGGIYGLGYAYLMYAFDKTIGFDNALECESRRVEFFNQYVPACAAGSYFRR